MAKESYSSMSVVALFKLRDEISQVRPDGKRTRKGKKVAAQFNRNATY